MLPFDQLYHPKKATRLEDAAIGITFKGSADPRHKLEISCQFQESRVSGISMEISCQKAIHLTWQDVFDPIKSTKVFDPFQHLGVEA